MNLINLSDKELLLKTENLVKSEREVLTEILHHLREIERRRLYSDLRQPSLFAYCTNVLKYSNGEADRKIKAMRLIKELPQIEEKVLKGELSLTNLAKAKELFNQEEKTGGFGIKEKLEVLGELENKSTREAEKILLSRSSGPASEVKQEKGRKYISVRVKNEVWQKSEGKCQICKSNFALEIDHLKPISHGGNSDPENLRLLCRRCNQRAAIKKIGDEHMARYLT